MRAPARPILALLACASLRAAAVELEDGKLSINGFGSWGYGVTSNRNTYFLAEPKGAFSSGEFALAANARLSERALVGAQVRFSPDEGTVIDWAFGEWRFSDVVQLRVGVVKHAFGLFGDVTHVGTLRPFFLLPSGIYGPSEVTGAGVRGFSVSGSLPSQTGWSFTYEVYGGSLKLPVSTLIDKLSDPSTLQPGGLAGIEPQETKYIGGGRAILATPVDGLELRLSVWGTPRVEDNAPIVTGGPSLQYLGERFSFRAEYFYSRKQGSIQRDQQRTYAGYVEAAWFATEKLQLGLRGEIYGSRLAVVPYTQLLIHRELAATVNYWFDPGLVVKASVHAIDGNRFASPLAIDEVLLGGPIQRDTLVLILGSQFSF